MTAAVLCLLAVTAVARRVEGSWFAPGALFAGYWSVWMVAAWVLGAGYTVPAAGPWFITAAAAAVLLGSFLGTKTEPTGPSPRAVPDQARTALRSARGLGLLGLAGGASGLLATLLIFRQSGFSLSSLTSQTGLFQVGNTLAVQRYSGEGQSLGLVALLLAVNYAGALAAPFLLVIPRSERFRSWWLPVFLPVLGALAFAVVTTARLPMLLGACFTLVSCIVAVSMRQGTLLKLRATQVLGAVASLGAVAAAFIFVAFIRIGPTSGSVEPIVFNGFRVYAIGYVSSFSQWIDQPSLNAAQATPPLALGASTFGAPARQLGMNPSLSQAYPDFRQLGRDPGAATNIYTAFRSAIVDFGAPGALVFLAAMGFVAARALSSVLRRAGPVSAVLLVAIYAYFLNSNIQSIFWFTNVCLGIVLAGVALVWTFRRSPARRPLELALR